MLSFKWGLFVNLLALTICGSAFAIHFSQQHWILAASMFVFVILNAYAIADGITTRR